MTGIREMERADRLPMIFASYNVHAWRGADGAVDIGQVLRVILDLKPDVIGLQEASFPLNDSPTINRQVIEAETGMYVAFGPTMLLRHADFGNILLSRHRFETLERYDITFRSREPRGIVEASIRIGNLPIRICVTHFGLNAVERIVQARRVARYLFRSPPASIYVAMGDFNDWIPGSPFIRPLLSHFPASSSPNSFPAFFPLLPLDRVLVGGKDVQRIHVTHHSTPETRVASDHLPVVARVEATPSL